MKELPYHTVRVDTWAEVPEGLRAVVEDVERRVIPAQKEGKAWDYMRIELWPDSGRFIVFPAHTEEEFRVDVTGSELVCKEIEADLLSLDLRKMGGEAFDRAAEEIYEKMVVLATTSFEALSCDSFEIWDADGKQR